MTEEPVIFPETTATGALSNYVANYAGKDFQPMGANFGVLPPLEDRPRDKALRGEMYASRALDSLDAFIVDNNL